jgi:hypothetical protein
VVLARPFFFITTGYFFTLEIILSISRNFFDELIARKQMPVKVQGRFSPPEAKNFADASWTQKVEAGKVEIKGSIHELELKPAAMAEWVFVPLKSGSYTILDFRF